MSVTQAAGALCIMHHDSAGKFSEDEISLMRPWELMYSLQSDPSSLVKLKKFTKILSDLALSIRQRANDRDLFAELKKIADCTRSCFNFPDMAGLYPEEEFHAQIFEVLCTLVELTVVFLSDYLGDPSNQTLKLPILKGLVEAISIALDSNMRYYSLRRENGNREILVLPSRLEYVLQVPGYIIRVFGATDSKTHYFCSQKGVNQLGQTCKCCTPPSEVDGVLMNGYWHLANTGGVNGYELLLKVLNTDTQLPLHTIAFILGLFAKALKCSSWSVLLQHLEGSFPNSHMMRICHSAYDKVFQCLKRALQNDCRSSKSPGFLDIFYSRSVFENMIILSHTIRRWSMSYSPAYRSADGAVLSFDDLDQLLILFLERTI